MDNQFISLLYIDQNSKDTENNISEDTISDIGFDDVKTVFKNTERYKKEQKKQLNRILTTGEAILYRQDILTDFLTVEGLKEDIGALLPNIYEMILELDENSFSNNENEQIREALGKIKIFELFTSCVDKLTEILKRYESEYNSGGLHLLKNRLNSLQQQKTYQTAKAILPGIRDEITKLGDFSVNVRFDSHYKPRTAAIDKSNTKSQDIITVAKTLFGVSENNNRYSLSIKSDSVLGIKGVFDKTFKRELNNLVKKARPILQAYSKEDISLMCTLDFEFDFYLAAVKFISFWNETGIKTCLPDILPKDQNICAIDDTLDLGLAIRMKLNKENISNIVSNPVRFDNDGRIFILTGANQGGKTTYIRSVGITYMLFQNGLYVPGNNAKISPVKNIFSHFPKEEQKIFGAGHLDEELDALRAILDKTQKGDLILLNESLSSTSMADSLDICTDYIRILSKIGVKCIFATHLHPLAYKCDSFNQEKSVNSIVDSLVVTIKEENREGVKIRKRTYRIERRMTDGESYADDIAKKHGMLYEQIMAKRKKQTKESVE